MKIIETGIFIQASREKVWEVLSDLGKYSEWNPFIPGISGELKEGARLLVRIAIPGGSPIDLAPIVKIAEPGVELRWLGRLWIPGLLDGEHSFRIEEAGEGHVHLVQSEIFRGILVPFLPSSLFERTRQGFEEMDRALKERVEGTGS